MPSIFLTDPLTGATQIAAEPPLVDLRIIEWQDDEDPGAAGRHIQYRREAQDWQDVPVQRVAPRENPQRLPIEPPPPFPSVPPIPDGMILTMPVQVFHDPTTGSLILFAADKHHAHGIFRASGWLSPDDAYALRAQVATLDAGAADLIARNRELTHAVEETERQNRDLRLQMGAIDLANRGLREQNVRSLDLAAGSTLSHIGRAMALLMLGRCARRAGWPSGAWIHRVSMPGLSAPTIVLHGADGSMQPWSATADDLLATDWCEVASNEAKAAV